MFISIKATRPHEGNLNARRIGNSRTQFFCMSSWDFWYTRAQGKKLAPLDTFLRDHEPNRVSEMNLNYLQNMPIYHLSRKYKLLIRSFLEYCYTVVFVHDISFPSKGRLLHETNVHKICPFLH